MEVTLSKGLRVHRILIALIELVHQLIRKLVNLVMVVDPGFKENQILISSQIEPKVYIPIIHFQARLLGIIRQESQKCFVEIYFSKR